MKCYSDMAQGTCVMIFVNVGISDLLGIFSSINDFHFRPVYCQYDYSIGS